MPFENSKPMNKSPKKLLHKLAFVYNFCFSIFLFVASSFLAISVKAQTQITEQQDWITRNQQNIVEEKKRNAEFETIKKEHDRKKKEEEKESQKLQPLVTGKTAACFSIKEIHLIDANSLSNYRKKKITAPFISKCLETKVLSDIIKAVNDYYQSQGYVTTQIKVPKQNLQNGIFELQIIEGKIEKISFGKDRLIENLQEFTAFGKAENSILNINDINQGMYQINRLQSNAAVMKIEPGSEIGNSKVAIDNNKKFPARFTIGKDNLGNDFTGVQRAIFLSASII